MTTRADDFAEIKTAILYAGKAASENAIVAEGDSLKLIRNMPSHSVSLILTDPPYHATKKKTYMVIRILKKISTI